ncbi:MAG: septal ring lytic transglycosylase RlpA family protein [Candidatus Binataceae bacterium]|jgi:rare lipoprotein A
MLNRNLRSIRLFTPLVLVIAIASLIGGCSETSYNYNPPVNQPAALNAVPIAPPPPAPVPQAKVVKASWYGPGLNGHVTTTGERFDDNRLTAASTDLPLGSLVKVTNPDNGRSVKVRINDCGPYVRGRSLDLSKRAAQKIGITHDGVTRVKVTPIKVPANAAGC